MKNYLLSRIVACLILGTLSFTSQVHAEEIQHPESHDNMKSQHEMKHEEKKAHTEMQKSEVSKDANTQQDSHATINKMHNNAKDDNEMHNNAKNDNEMSEDEEEMESEY